MRAPLLLFLLPLWAHAQTSISGRVVDSDTHEPLPYCSVGIRGTTTGTLTNEAGAFALRMDTTHAMVLFSYIGYRQRTMAANELLNGADVLLEQLRTELPGIDVRPDQDRLYAVFAACARHMRQSKQERAKVYYELDTHMDERPVEVIECFYNALIDGPRIKRLDLKNGRVGVAPVDDHYFVSLNVTKAMSLFDLRREHAKFPTTPFQWTSERALRKHYRIELVASVSDGEALEHVRLVPRDSSGTAFIADVWLNEATATVRSIELECRGCQRHPFLPLKAEHPLRDITMRVKQTFRMDEGLEHMELDYAMRFSERGTSHAVHTQAVMHVFEPGGAFILPLFDYDREQSDYRKITFQPYDTAFWANTPTLVRTEQQERDREFFAEHGVLTGSTRVAVQRGTLFESNYAWWSPSKRISLKTFPSAATPGAPSKDIQSKGMAIAASQVHLEAQLYLDIDTTGGHTRLFTATVFDGFRSYYRLPDQPHTPVILNIFFDLCEIERRTMDARMRAPGLGLDRIRALHAEAVKAMERTTQLYLKEVRLGEDRQALARWNALVKDALGIDNIALFTH